jgi:hypothetical protein
MHYWAEYLGDLRIWLDGQRLSCGHFFHFRLPCDFPVPETATTTYLPVWSRNNSTRRRIGFVGLPYLRRTMSVLSMSDFKALRQARATGKTKDTPRANVSVPSQRPLSMHRPGADVLPTVPNRRWKDAYIQVCMYLLQASRPSICDTHRTWRCLKPIVCLESQ